MKFRVLPVNSYLNNQEGGYVYLIEDNWNDWWKYRTMYQMYFKEDNDTGEVTYIGTLKIGDTLIKEDQDRVAIDKEFESLEENFFSLGQDRYYYENLNRLGDQLRDEILNQLNDISLDLNLFEKVKDLDISEVSVMRDISKKKIKTKFNKLARGYSELTEYDFTFSYSTNKNQDYNEIQFNSVPNANPPTNVQAIIGRNGVGKTHLLNQIVATLIDPKSEKINTGSFTNLMSSKEKIFDNIIYLSFSAFDEALFYYPKKIKKNGVGYTYIGLKTTKNSRKKSDEIKKEIITKTTEQLRYELLESMWNCKKIPSKNARLEEAIGMLDSDPIFSMSEVSRILKTSELELAFNKKSLLKESEEEIINQIKTEFVDNATPIIRKFSSGHSIVLLTVTKLIEEMEEKTLVLLDEPESHLHPPLLSTFTRILSSLLVNRNGIGIIATHSPVVLQEIPSKCVWIADRFGTEFILNRPEVETFGENINTLTKKVFSYEITESGFHKLLKEVANKADSYEDALKIFNNEVGMEAKAVLKTMMWHKELE